MFDHVLLFTIAAGAALWILLGLQARLRLTRAKHPSLQGHAAIARRIARIMPFYEYGGEKLFACDGAPEEVARQRKTDFERLGAHFSDRAPKTLAAGKAIESGVSDASFVNAHRVPFQFRSEVRRTFPLTNLVDASHGNRVRDLDGNWSYDLSGSYGVNVFGHELYKQCLERGFERAQPLGPVLGAYHPVVNDNVERLRRLSGLDEVSFHMSGTEAVMQAVRLARYHTNRPRIVRFAGAYHGWWDGVQVGIGSQRRATDVYTLRDMHPASLKVLQTRRDIAAVLVSPLQTLHPNRAAPGDATLVSGRDGTGGHDRDRYARWLHQLRSVCSERGIALIMDEVFSGFRLAAGGAQEYFGVAADLVTYGKSLGGGLPVGVLCGTHHFMKRYRDDRPMDVCFARGTFNSHPYVMTCMNEFLRHLESPAVASSYEQLHPLWDRRTATLNRALEERDLPIRLANVGSLLTVHYLAPSRYNWMFQFYLRAHELSLSWTGTGRLIMSHDYTEADFAAVSDRFLAAAEKMRHAGWWWHPPKWSDRANRRQILREMLAARLGGYRTLDASGNAVTGRVR